MSPPIAPNRRNKQLRALTDNQILEMRSLYYGPPHATQSSLATRFHVSEYTVWRWLHNITPEELVVAEKGPIAEHDYSS